LLKNHVDAVSLANNHTGDYGKAAFAEMLSRLQQAGLPYFGGGMDWREAHKPLIIERNGLKIALLGYNEFLPREFEAGEKLPGSAWSEDEQVVTCREMTYSLLDTYLSSVNFRHKSGYRQQSRIIPIDLPETTKRLPARRE